jgi:hypothetical protein
LPAPSSSFGGVGQLFLSYYDLTLRSLKGMATTGRGANMSDAVQRTVDDLRDGTVTPLRTDQDLPDIGQFIAECNKTSKAHEALYSSARQATDIASRAEEAADRAHRAQESAEVDHAAVQAEDPDRRASRPRQWIIAGAALALDGAACYFAAEALDADRTETVAWALLFVALLGIGELGLDHFRDDHRIAWRCTALAEAGFIGLLGVLRFSFLATVSAVGLLTALAGSALLSIATTGFVLIGYHALRVAETGPAWRARRTAMARAREAAAARGTARRRGRYRDRLAHAYLSRIRLQLVGTCPGSALAHVERAIWSHLTGKDQP